ncbi:nuclear transcription factor Y subunit A-7-like isoform X2 [Olea europaea var. sylvestris]|uniref:nuclear transcription factor Y subunit A-7-like isoform X2 n=1 Tax=Olea europaea var. sylvestris TaxID=158386 RepID=UPI000C1CEE44|nr:nuclear transcription factor Y subunit A-7-like isoform X2 [Olea europaea var. sylvestris]
MTSSIHSLSDNSEADEQQKHAEPQVQSNVMSYTGIALPNMNYATSTQLGAENAVAQTPYLYSDPYYRSIFPPYDAQPYPAQPMLMGIQQAGLPLPSDAVEVPVFVNAKQYHGILRRRQSRAKAESKHKVVKSRKCCSVSGMAKPYLHESRHLHAVRRVRGKGGRFKKKSENQQQEVESGEESQANFNLNSDKKDPSSLESAS